MILQIILLGVFSMADGGPASGINADKRMTVTVSEDFFNIEPDEQTKLILREIKKLRHEVRELRTHYETRVVGGGAYGDSHSQGGTGMTYDGTQDIPGGKIIFEGGGHMYTIKKDDCGK